MKGLCAISCGVTQMTDVDGESLLVVPATRLVRILARHSTIIMA